MAIRVRDAGCLLLRWGIAFALIPHGWNKLTNWGYSGTVDNFAQTGTPEPNVTAAFAMAVEIGAPVLLVLGLLTPLAGAGIVAVMAGGLLTAPDHLFAAGGGLIPWHTAGAALDQGTGLLDEQWTGASAFLFLLLGLAVLITGAGRISVDRRVFQNNRWLAPRE
ncbi:hypothetical protein AXK57_10565 [Tsukamurella pulmonis]|uniref:DoxX family protein n=1 Tax=Tsukamurella pulmonis TaxID=47312 RepID=UPI00079C3FEA|nr:DoxX family protein [Tsukamurella pulmonis]KXP09337.1 hypothetical protein AXK57_10565 [Tsukamurella pulmonis]RDH10367.1 DoxX family protein [Tsukamurella pulmonis]